MVKTCTVLGCDGYKNEDIHGGAMKKVISEASTDQVVFAVFNPSNGKRWAKCSPDKLIDITSTNNFVYEVLRQFPMKLYFDIDNKSDIGIGLLPIIKDIIIEYFPNAEFAVSGSCTPTKTSFHIVVPNYVITNKDELEFVKSIVGLMYVRNPSFDKSVYHLNRLMKCINQSKGDDRVQTIIEDSIIINHYITCFINESTLPFDRVPEAFAEEAILSSSKSTFNLGTLPKLKLVAPDNVDMSSITPEEILGLLPNTSEMTFNYKHMVLRYAYYNRLPFELFYAWVSSIYPVPDESRYTKWKNHWDTVGKFTAVSFERISYVLKYFYKSLGKSIYLRQFTDSFVLPESNVVKVDTLTPEVFTLPTTSIVLNTGMGSGKTTQTIEYLRFSAPSIWITSNIALAMNTCNRFEQSNIDVSYYKAFKKDEKFKMNSVKNLIICLNSLHYLDKCKSEVIVIDEIETLLNKFEGDFMRNKPVIWNIFIRLLLSAKKIILLDAFITRKTIDLLDKLSISYTIVERVVEPYTRHINYMSTSQYMIHDIIDKLNSGNKVLVFYPYKMDGKTHASVDTLVRTLESKTNKKGIGYHGDSADKKKKTLKKVNEVWNTVDFVVSNNVITCGLSYENLDYSYIYMFIAPFNLPRDMIQFTYRIRALQSNNINVCFIGSSLTISDTWVNDCRSMADPVYTMLYNNVLTEYKSPSRETFKFLCNKAKYTQSINNTELSKSLIKNIDLLISQHALYILWDDIPEISSPDAEYIKQLCISADASMMEKYMLSKFYFINQFEDLSTFSEEVRSTLKTMWDNKCIFFLKRIQQILNEPTNIFNKIMIYNKQEDLFPETIDIKVSPEITELIFKEFSFKRINRSSCSKKIFKTIYNNYFKQEIIDVEYYANSKNTQYKIYGDYNMYYDFCREFMKNKTKLVAESFEDPSIVNEELLIPNDEVEELTW